MSFSNAIGQVDQIVQWEQQLADPAALTQTSSIGTSSGTSSTSASDGTSSASQTSFADTLAAAQADTEASAADTLSDPTDTSTDSSTGASGLLGGGDSQLLSALSSLSSSATGSTDSTSSSDASALANLDSIEAGSTDGTDLTDGTNSTASLLSALQSAESDQTSVNTDSGASGGEATSAADPRIQAMTEEANALVGKPYVWGGGHSGWGPSTGYDCSGFVSAVLHAGGYLTSPQDTTTLPSSTDMSQGPGQYVTVYDRDQPGKEGHVIIDINGQFYESGGEQGSWGGGGGVEEISQPSAAYLSTFNVILHPTGL